MGKEAREYLLVLAIIFTLAVATAAISDLRSRVVELEKATSSLICRVDPIEACEPTNKKGR